MISCADTVSSIYYLFLWVYKVLMNKSGKALLLLLLLFAGYYLMFCGSLTNSVLSSSHQSIQLGYQKITSRSPKEHSSMTVLFPAHHIRRHSSVNWGFTVLIVLCLTVSELLEEGSLPLCLMSCGVIHAFHMQYACLKAEYHHCSYQYRAFLPSVVLEPFFSFFLIKNLSTNNLW